MTSNIFSAEEPTLGYLYQVNYSLLLLIQSANVENAKIAIEKLDDIQLEVPDLSNLYQTKYHLNSVANLTDRSADLWKTLRVWSDNITNDLVKPESTIFHLVTTAEASVNTIAYELRKSSKERNIKKLIEDLDKIATETTNQTNKNGYDAYQKLSIEEKTHLLSNIYLIDSSIGIEEIKKEIYAELRKTIIDNKVPALYERICGWYLEKTIASLLGKVDYVTFREYQNKCFEVVDTLKMDNLPADFPNPIEFSESELLELKERTFVKQLDIVGVTGNSAKTAISDYHRAYEQRSRWLRESLINPEDEIAYEKKLFDDWQRKFDLVIDESDNKSNEEHISIGKAFYVSHYVNTYPRIFIKERFEHVYMVTGSCHILSDGKKIGWHPLFKEIL